MEDVGNWGRIFPTYTKAEKRLFGNFPKKKHQSISSFLIWEIQIHFRL